jgi:hypothetical protein
MKRCEICLSEIVQMTWLPLARLYNKTHHELGARSVLLILAWPMSYKGGRRMHARTNPGPRKITNHMDPAKPEGKKIIDEVL